VGLPDSLAPVCTDLPGRAFEREPSVVEGRRKLVAPAERRARGRRRHSSVDDQERALASARTIRASPAAGAARADPGRRRVRLPFDTLKRTSAAFEVEDGELPASLRIVRPYVVGSTT
jgi:hypothetical protein